MRINYIFIIIFISSIYIFIKNIRKIFRNINLGLPYEANSLSKGDKIKFIFKITIDQSKIFKKPISGILHFIVFLGFIIVNIEIVEIIIDGTFNTHRFLGNIFPQNIYNIFIVILEILAFLTLVSVIILFIRRNFSSIKRFKHKDLNGWARLDGNLILVFEILLMTSFLLMNSADYQMMILTENKIIGNFSISTFLFDLKGLEFQTLYGLEKFCWWFHILGILFFLNYIYYSKHLHIITAFPNIYYSSLEKTGILQNMNPITFEIKSMMGLDTSKDKQENVKTFGAKDIFDLNKKQLLEVYTCTECGRCTDVCPANITGKKLSPRNIIMKTRDRLEEVGKNIDKNNTFIKDDFFLLDNYITREEIWACTTCMACVDACPLNINPMNIIIDLRRYISMEESKIPLGINDVNNNIEINHTPWKFSKEDRDKWANDL